MNRRQIKKTFDIALGKRIDILRKKNKHTMQNVADFLGITDVAVSNVIHGKQGLSTHDVWQLCKLFNCELSELFHIEKAELEAKKYSIENIKKREKIMKKIHSLRKEMDRY